MSGSPASGPTDVTDPVDAVDTTTPRLAIMAGGTPSDAELAALVVALTPSGAQPAGPEVPAWRRAALLEGAGGAGVHAPSDLALGAR